jgi:hypothetical protein
MVMRSAMEAAERCPSDLRSAMYASTARTAITTKARNTRDAAGSQHSRHASPLRAKLSASSHTPHSGPRYPARQPYVRVVSFTTHASPFTHGCSSVLGPSGTAACAGGR